ncbi:MAG TPA: hypothetical protein VIF15_15705 [Polyangiaceae bacterium]|jgi:hypothetical protein
MGDDAPRWQQALACVSALLVSGISCIPDPLTGPTDGSATALDGEQPVDGPGGGSDGASDGAGDDVSAGQDGIAPADAGSDVPPLPDGSIRCGETATICDLSTSFCCDQVYGQMTDAGEVFNLNQPQCQALDASSCGSFTSIGGNFNYQFPQTCMAGVGCGAGTVCCVVLKDAGGITSVAQIQCQSALACGSGRTLCQSSSDCRALQSCQPETDPFLSNLYPRYCQ